MDKTSMGSKVVKNKESGNAISHGIPGLKYYNVLLRKTLLTLLIF